MFQVHLTITIVSPIYKSVNNNIKLFFKGVKIVNERQKRLKQMEQKGYLAIPPKQREKNLKQALASLKELFVKDYKAY